MEWEDTARRMGERSPGGDSRLRGAIPWVLAAGLSLAGFTFAHGCRPAAAGPGGPATGPAEETFDHSAFTSLLRTYVDEDGLVNYKAWKAKDLPALEKYLGRISAADPEELKGKEEQIAFWINAYNALTIKGIIEFYPLKSIKDKVSRVFGYNIWDDYLLEVGGEERSLNWIEHQKLRKMGEPRIHFALVCASMSCPKIRREAYTGAELTAQLESQAKEFLNDPSRTKVDLEAKKAHLSKIFDWFEEDFGGSKAASMKFIAPYRPESERAKLEEGKLSVSYLDYDWSLNEPKE